LKRFVIVECYHCGENTARSVIAKDDKSFCCNGCLSVYEILKQYNLNLYYSLESSPGVKPAPVENHEWNFLLNEEVVESLIQYKDGNTSIVQIQIPEIHCSSCIWLLENIQKINAGILQSEVNFMSKTVRINFNHNDLSLAELAQFLTEMGYRPNFKLGNTGEKKNSHSTLLKLGVAGFCFGNVMLLSFPEYISGNTSLGEFRLFFSYLILGLSIPVLFYSASDFFVSTWRAFKTRAVNIDVPISIGIITLFSKSLYDILSGLGPGYMDSFIGFVFFLLIGQWFKSKSFEALSFDRDYKSYFPLVVSRANDDSEEVVLINSINVGDHLIVRNNDVIPVDCRVVAGKSEIDYSFVTGEADRVEKIENDQIFAGGRHFGQAIKIEVLKKVDQSYLTGLWNHATFSTKKRPEGQQAQLSKFFILAVLSITVIAGLVWSFIDIASVAGIITSILIVACPCAIALAAPFSYGNALRTFGRKKLFVKDSAVIQPMAEITDIVFDKTGTLTSRREYQIDWQGDPLTKQEKSQLATLVYQSSHPISASIFNSLESPVIKKTISDFKEFAGKGIQGAIHGVDIKLGSSSFFGKTTDTTQNVHVSIGNRYKGSFMIKYKFRAGTIETIDVLAQQYNLHVLSGDNESDKTRLNQIFGKASVLKFHQRPIDKLNYVQSLIEKGSVVMMIGDGLNDAGALKVSDVGVVVSDNINNFSPASDAILDSNQFSRIHTFLNFSKITKRILRVAIILSILYNIIGLYFAVTNQLTPLIAAILMPLSSISIIAFTSLSVQILDRVKMRN
jgi:P-type Cu+ transporter